MSSFADIDLSSIRVPSASTTVSKDECAYSMRTALDDHGLFVDLHDVSVAVSLLWLPTHVRKTRHRLFAQLQTTIVERAAAAATAAAADVDDTAEREAKKPRATVLGVGVEGGFDPDAAELFEERSEWRVVLLPAALAPGVTGDELLAAAHSFAADDAALPSRVRDAVAGVRANAGAARREDVEKFVLADERPVSAYADALLQFDNGKRVPPSGWRCEVAGCDKTEGLWLNLTDGCIKCGRRNFDGSGGNSHGFEHFQNTGYPLAVKLGTISADPDTIDIHSYGETHLGETGIMVRDPHIVRHLAHFGIDIASMKQSEKGMAELQLDAQYRLDSAVLEKHGDAIYGAGYTGLINLGNSCYINSMLQLVFATETARQQYVADARALLENAPADVAGDLDCQFAKVGAALVSGEYAQPPPPESAGALATKLWKKRSGVTPRALRALVARGHREFQTPGQQDALEWLQHLLVLMQRADKKSGRTLHSLPRAFGVKLEERLECSQSHTVAYADASTTSLMLPVPLDRATNKGALAADGKPARPLVPLAACFRAWAAMGEVDNWLSPATQQRTVGFRQSRIAAFPPYLVVALRKFTVSASWAPVKIDVEFDVPDVIDLEFLRARGRQAGEAPMPTAAAAAAAAQAAAASLQPDEMVVSTLVSMGFPENRARKAAVKTSNAGADRAMEWLLENMDAADIDEPLVAAGGAAAAAAAPVDEESVAQLVSMGFSVEHATRALRETAGNVERAMDWIFSHPEDELAAAASATSATPAVAAASPPGDGEFLDGPAKYRVRAFVSHIGSSVHSGHYVCHVTRDGTRWAIFNDRVVAECSDVPIGMAYVYLLERVNE